MQRQKWSIETLAIHGGQEPELWQGSTISPIYQTASHSFSTAEELSDVFSGKSDGFLYQRINNPTNQTLEKKLALLEGGEACIVTSTGMAAVNNAIMAICRTGDEILCGNSLFMSTFLLFNNVLSKFGIKVRMVDTLDIGQWKSALSTDTKLLFVEVIGNPKMDVPDIEKLSKLAHEAEAPLIVDSTLATPYLFKPLECGADVVVHSTTKFLNGHGTAVGGAIICNGAFTWPEEKYPDFLPYVETNAKLAYITKVRKEIHVNFGTSQAPVHSFLTLLGLDTFALRMERHLANAQKVAAYLHQHSKVKWVNYPGLKEMPWHDVAVRQFQGKGFGALLTFGLEDEASCFELIRNLRLVTNLANLGDCKTLIIHPWSSQYIGLPKSMRTANGIKEDLLRVSVGIEGIDDILADLDQALTKI